MRSALRDETGFGLVEVLVSAVLVVLVSLGVYAGMDGASATSGVNKMRSLATEVAQQDQDRMRAMTINELSNYRATQTTTLDGVTFTVVSRGDWITDSTGAANCTSGTTQANYVRIASSVTWPRMRVAPVTVESLAAPPSGSFSSTQGSLAVQVNDRNGNGVPGVTVSLAGPKAYSDVTNANGCVLWGYLPASSGGAYTVGLSKAGFVDPSGATAPTQQADVTGEATNTVTFSYDLGGRITGNYETLNGSTPIAANGLSFMASNANLPSNLGPFGDGTAHTSFTTTGLLYPFTLGYSVWAGDCAGAKPASQYLPAPVVVTPGGTTSVTLREPPVAFQVKNGSAVVNGATVRFTPTGSGCSTKITRTTGANGFITDQALPYNTYTFCAQMTNGGSTVRKTTAVSGATSLASSTPTGVAASTAVTIDLSAGTTSGACP